MLGSVSVTARSFRGILQVDIQKYVEAEDDRVLHLHFVIDLDALCIITSQGHLLTLLVDTLEVEEVKCQALSLFKITVDVVQFQSGCTLQQGCVLLYF